MRVWLEQGAQSHRCELFWRENSWVVPIFEAILADEEAASELLQCLMQRESLLLVLVSFERLSDELFGRGWLPQVPEEGAEIATEVASRSLESSQHVCLLCSQECDALAWIGVGCHILVA